MRQELAVSFWWWFDQLRWLLRYWRGLRQDYVYIILGVVVFSILNIFPISGLAWFGVYASLVFVGTFAYWLNDRKDRLTFWIALLFLQGAVYVSFLVVIGKIIKLVLRLIMLFL